MNAFLYGVFVSPHGGLGGPPSFFGLLIHQRRGDRAVGSGGFLFYACYWLSLLRGWCVAYVGDASNPCPQTLQSNNHFLMFILTV
jgi:hypothetical protein